MLIELQLKNFKAWQDSGRIRMAPLTVLFGTNSAGKTSIPQMLLLLKQTAESTDRLRALHFGDDRTFINAGTFDEAIHGHDVSQPLEFALAWSLEQLLEISDPITNTTYAGDRLQFSARVEADERHQPRVTRLRYQLRDGTEDVLDLEMARSASSKTDANQPEFDLSSERYALRRVEGRNAPLPPPLRFYGFPDEVQAFYQNAGFAADLVLELERMLRSIFYVGPLREYPRRLYAWSGDAPDHVGERGDRAIEALLAGGDRTYSFEPGQEEEPLPQVVAERLQQMGLIHDFEVRRLGAGRNEYEVMVKTRPGASEVKLTDVGFGVTQVLPVIVESFYVPRRSIVIFEQPEIHLHPRAQADLADLFVDAIRAREDGLPRDCQFIIESHSEHFLRRLQRRIAEEQLSSDDAALYFVDSGAAGARLEELAVDEFGNINNWPAGFFGDEMEDLVARAEAQARRMQSRSNA